MSSIVRASFGQERMWFIESLSRDSGLYNELLYFRITGSVDAGILGRGIDEVIRRHEALRTRFIVIDGMVYQDVLEPSPLNLQFIDLSGREDPLIEADRMIMEEWKKPIDLSRGPLFRTFLYRLGQNDHLLVMVIHHIVIDGWSIVILMRELSTFYGSIASGVEPSLPPAPIQYRGYAERQRNAFESGGFNEQIEYWSKKLGGELPVLQLPFDHKRTAVQSYDGMSLTMVLSPVLTASLKALAKKEKSTLFMVLLTAFYALLYRYTGQEDLVVGTPIAGRNQSDIEGMIGLCINTLALRCDVEKGQTFTGLLKKVRRLTLEAYENQDLPFDKLVERLSLHRSLDVPPVFQALFHLRNFSAREAVIGDAILKRHEPDNAQAKVDLTLEVTETREGLSCRFEYPVTLFEKDTLVRMASHWRILLEDIVSVPNKTISGLRLMDRPELDAVMALYMGLDAGYHDKNISCAFEAWSRRSPEAVAVMHGQETLTYAELNRLADILASHLKGSGVSMGDTVAICMKRSSRMVAAMLGVVKAGAAYVPIDPSDPAARIEGMLEDVKPKMVIDESYAFEGPAISLDPGTGLDSMAYIMFTSGSTGKPKGVCVRHRGILRLTVSADYVSIKPGDRVAHISNPAFDATTFEVWGALLNGATVVILDKDEALSAAGLTKAIANGRIDVMFMTTPLFHAIASVDPAAFKGIRDLLVGGEVMDPARAAQVIEASAPHRFLNVYGPTENTTFSTYYEIKEMSNNIPIGRPIAGTSLYVLDGERQPVPAGIAGEIYLGGDGVAAGYFSRPDLTSATFYPDPFRPGGMMYRTGDLGRMMPDGNVLFLGRADGQVKIRGFRVEAGEIASALEGYDGVRKAVVRVIIGPDGSRALVAYLAGDPAPEEAMMAYLSKKLPAYMIPSSIIWVDDIPLTSRGKIDYGALPSPERGTTACKAPLPYFDWRLDEHLDRMTSIWQEVLGLREVSPDDDFFRLGGHSLLAVRLIGRVESAFNVRLPVSVVFTASTARSMTHVIMGGHYERNDSILITMIPGGDAQPLFCVHGAPGTLFDYDYIAPLIGRARPVYGLQSPGLDGRSKTPNSVEELASVHVREILKVRPHGPYYILAHCWAGAIAFEIARQLEKEGKTPEFLGIIDYSAPATATRRRPGNFKRHRRFIADNLGGLAAHTKAFIRAGMRDKVRKAVSIPSFFTRKALSLPEELAFYANAEAAKAFPGWILCFSEPQRSVAMTNYDAISRYKFPKYSGNVTVFISSVKAGAHKASGDRDESFGWGRIAGGVSVHVIDGDHESMKGGEAAKAIANVMKGEIDDAGTG